MIGKIKYKREVVIRILFLSKTTLVSLLVQLYFTEVSMISNVCKRSSITVSICLVCFAIIVVLV